MAPNPPEGRQKPKAWKYFSGRVATRLSKAGFKNGSEFLTHLSNRPLEALREVGQDVSTEAGKARAARFLVDLKAGLGADGLDLSGQPLQDSSQSSFFRAPSTWPLTRLGTISSTTQIDLWLAGFVVVADIQKASANDVREILGSESRFDALASALIAAGIGFRTRPVSPSSLYDRPWTLEPTSASRPKALEMLPELVQADVRAGVARCVKDLLILADGMDDAGRAQLDGAVDVLRYFAGTDAEEVGVADKKKSNAPISPRRTAGFIVQIVNHPHLSRDFDDLGRGILGRAVEVLAEMAMKQDRRSSTPARGESKRGQIGDAGPSR